MKKVDTVHFFYSETLVFELYIFCHCFCQALSQASSSIQPVSIHYSMLPCLFPTMAPLKFPKQAHL